MNNSDIVSEYETGKYTVKELANMHGISAGKMYYLLRDNGCVFSKKWRKQMSQAEREKRRRLMKGRKFSPEVGRKISEAKSSKFDGMNGYGKPKKRCTDGYMAVHAPKHPHATKEGYVMLHTVLMERAIGRYLNENEVVHHINHVRDDSRLENLRLMDKHEHMSMHMKERHANKRRNDLLTASSSQAD